MWGSFSENGDLLYDVNAEVWKPKCRYRGMDRDRSTEVRRKDVYRYLAPDTDS